MTYLILKIIALNNTRHHPALLQATADYHTLHKDLTAQYCQKYVDIQTLNLCGKFLMRYLNPGPY